MELSPEQFKAQTRPTAYGKSWNKVEKTLHKKESGYQGALERAMSSGKIKPTATVNSSGQVRDGHHRAVAAMKLGYSIQVELNDNER